MKQILVTGASGFIGRAVVKELLFRGYEVHAIYCHTQLPQVKNLFQYQLDLLEVNSVRSFFHDKSFEIMIHLAWYVGPKCHQSNINIDWVIASLQLLQFFKESGGKVCLCNGTVSEYDFSFGYLSEDTTPLKNPSLHGICKSSCFSIIRQFCKQNSINFKWTRCFNLYGPNERPQRLMPSVIVSCLKGENVRVSECLKYQDYLYVEDTARGIIDVLETDIYGDINICSGCPILLRDIVKKIACLTNFKGKILWGAIPSSFEDELIVGNNQKLKSIGWQQKYSLEEGLVKTINWWKKNYV